MITDEQLSELVAQVARWGLAGRHRLVTAESCTGGWIAKVCTDAAGSSRWFDSGLVTYSNEAKSRELDVSARTLEVHGAVSEATVREMAAGALRSTGADVSIAVSGIAGPEGGSVEKPVGTVWFCAGLRRNAAAASAADSEGRSSQSGPHPAADVSSGIELLVAGERFGGNREAVRRASVQRALQLLLQFDKRD